MGHQEQEKQIEEILSYYETQPGDQENYRLMLEELQEVTGFLSQDLLERAAQARKIKTTVLSCLVKFSSTLKLAPYKHKIVACTGERCGKKDGLRLLQFLKKELQTDASGLSSDKKILLTTQNCLKHCKTSPNLLIDGEIHSHMAEESLRELLKTLR